MKKIFISAFITSVLFSSLAFCADNFALGKAAFAKKDYISARSYLVKHLTEKPNDANARYYYAQTLTYLEDYKQARIEFGYVAQLAPNSTVGNYAKTSIIYLDKKLQEEKDANVGQNDNMEQSSDSDNYISKAVENNGEISIWDVQKMPIKVYFDMSSRPKSSYIQAFKNAANTWQNANNGLISFSFVNNSSDADVIVQILGTAPKNNTGLLGITHNSSKNGYIYSSEITLYSLDVKYRALNAAAVYNTSLHEIGHLLGIAGHSENKDDIMAPSTKTDGSMQTLSVRDINTYKAIYELDRNPYSTSENSINKLLGSKDERMSYKLKEAVNYTKEFPQNPIGFTNLAIIYIEQNQDYEAIQACKKAIALDPLNYTANFNIGYIYGKQNDLKNAEPYYKNAIKARPADPDAYCNLANLYMKNNKMQLAKSTITTLIYRNSAAKNNEKVKYYANQLNIN